MGIRTTAARLLSAPTLAVLEAALRDLVDEALDSRAYVSRDEIGAVEGAIEELRRSLATRRSDLDALRQAIEAFSLDLEDPLDDGEEDDYETAISRLESSRDKLQKQLDRALGALKATNDQLQGVATELETLGGRVDKAQQLATSARATAEAAADGISGLESQLTA
jgi:chromosome segregation ATPase